MPSLDMLFAPENNEFVEVRCIAIQRHSPKPLINAFRNLLAMMRMTTMTTMIRMRRST